MTRRLAGLVLLLWAMAAAGQSRPGFMHTPAAPVAGQPYKIEGTFVNDGSYSELIARVRSPGEAFEELILDRKYGDLYRVTVDAARVRAPGFEYYVEAATPGGDRVAIFASADRPQRVNVGVEPKGKKKKADDEPPPEPVVHVVPIDAPDVIDPPGPPRKKVDPFGDEVVDPPPTKKKRVVEDEEPPKKKKKKDPDPIVEDTPPPTKAQPKKKVVEAPVEETPAPRVAAKTPLDEELATYSAENSSAVVQRLDASSRRSPLGRTVFTALQLRQLGVRYVMEALELVAGISISRDVQGSYHLAVRGLRSDPEVLITLNGQRLNAFYDGRALANVPVDNLERIEVIKGPATVDTAMGDYGAVVNLVTNKADGLRAGFAGGTYSTFDGHLAAAHHFGPLQLFVDGDVASQDGFRKTVLKDGLDSATLTRDKASVDRRLLVNVGLGATIESDDVGALTVQGRVLYENRTALIGAFDAVGNDTNLQWLIVQAQASWSKELFEGGKLSARLYFDQQSTDRLWQLAPDGYQARPTDEATRFPDGVLESVKVGGRSAGLSAKLDIALPANNTLTVGLSGDLQGLFDASWRFNYTPGSLTYTGTELQPAPVRLPTQNGGGGRGLAADRFGFGLFAGDVFQPFEWLCITAGVRLDLVQLPTADATGAWSGTHLAPGIGPRVGIVFLPMAPLAFRINYGRSFRAPTVQELAEQFPNTDFNQGRFVGNPKLEGTSVDAFEAGFEFLQAVGEAKVRLKGQAFYNRYTLPISAIDTTGNLTPFQNRAQGIHAFGLEGEGRLELSPRAAAWINASWVRAEDLGTPATGRLLTDVPQARLNVGFTIPLGQWIAIDAMGRFESERRNNSRSVLELVRRYSLPANFIVGAQLRTELLFEHLELAVTGQNVFNLDYADDATRPDRLPAGVPREGRQRHGQRTGGVLMRLLNGLFCVVFATGCVQFNDQCQPLVNDPNTRVAFIAKGTEVYLDRPNARHANNAIAQQAADAFVWVFSEGEQRKASFAVVNGGAIRAEGLCVTRNILKEGPLTNGVLHEVLLFENAVAAVDLTEPEVVEMFEHGVERLFATPSPIVSPSGAFLQVSSAVAMTVDCSQPAGQRVTALKIAGQAVPLAQPRADTKYRVAASAFVLQGGDGYTNVGLAYRDPSRNAGPAQRFGGVDSDITAEYLKQSSANVSIEAGFKLEPRITFVNCTQATKPAN